MGWPGQDKAPGGLPDPRRVFRPDGILPPRISPGAPSGATLPCLRQRREIAGRDGGRERTERLSAPRRADAVTAGKILVGVVGAPHGIRGEVRIKSFTADPLAIATYGPLRSQDGGRVVRVAAVRALKDDMVVARLEGIASRDAAAALTGLRLTVDRTALPAAAEDEFYHADLIGLAAIAADGAPLGRVAAVVNYGAGDILEIVAEEGDPLLVAFTAAFVPVIDIAAGRLIIALAALAAASDEGEPQDGAPR